ncbi:hypothetical protein LB542_04130 [Mesorhizobium sp. BR1-1-9]|nr:MULTISPECIES: hypothetical protein [unclassified Mesorhizobium]MBZ9870050.1 hypothetical protein [Mesorhizobium sp. BR1-1-9]MBZ9943608.1 hypothetical protein [Mesorhizobium sp. BR1-1-13]
MNENRAAMKAQRSRLADTAWRPAPMIAARGHAMPAGKGPTGKGKTDV